jgi:hypothetical protein
MKGRDLTRLTGLKRSNVEVGRIPFLGFLFPQVPKKSIDRKGVDGLLFMSAEVPCFRKRWKKLEREHRITFGFLSGVGLKVS